MSGLLRLGVLLSGSGTNLQALIDTIAAGTLGARITVVISNEPAAQGLVRATQHGIPTVLVPHGAFATRTEFDAKLVEVLRAHDVELVVLAGFMRLVTPVLLGAFPSRVLNIHPALLPAFPGLHAERQALAYGARVTGVTVHFVDEHADHGPIIVQIAVPVLPGDDEARLHARLQRQEHRAYARAIQLIAEGRVRIDGRRVHIDGAAANADDTLASPAFPVPRA